AIDIIDGKCVRLAQGDYSKETVYSNNPLEVAKKFEANGIRFLHLVDLDGARSSKVVNWKVLEQISSQTGLQIDFGGGIKSDADIKMVFESGAAQVTCGSVSIKSPELFFTWLKEYGGYKIMLGADARNQKIAVSGWNEETDKNVIEFIDEYVQKGIEYCICTDISKDGMLQGPSVHLYRDILRKQPGLKLIASGGVSSMDDIYELANMKLDGVILGKAIYEERILLTHLQNYISSC
ncbi:MAG: 1-(5-phosphoribosyl)-5-[(5-phosphoribosylamino)methylideneamino]imidazole-4-carboxamide isomerase, partial [Flavobacteriales bacterium]